MVTESWDAIKRQEKGQKNTAQTMEQIPHSLPALMYAEKMQSRAQKGGFQRPALPQALEALQQLAAGLGPAPRSRGAGSRHWAMCCLPQWPPPACAKQTRKNAFTGPANGF